MRGYPIHDMTVKRRAHHLVDLAKGRTGWCRATLEEHRGAAAIRRPPERARARELSEECRRCRPLATALEQHDDLIAGEAHGSPELRRVWEKRGRGHDLAPCSDDSLVGN